MQLFFVSPANSAPSEDDGAKDTKKAAVDAAKNKTGGALYKTIIDEKSGQYAVVNSNQEIVTLKDRHGKVIWNTNVVEALKSVPISGERKIRNMQLMNGDLIVRFSRGFVKIDKKTGAVTWLGSN
jgi:outer membrane protein assembly factor BamB